MRKYNSGIGLKQIGEGMRKLGRSCGNDTFLTFVVKVGGMPAFGKQLEFEAKLEGLFSYDADHNRPKPVAQALSTHGEDVAHGVMPCFNKAYAYQCA